MSILKIAGGGQLMTESIENWIKALPKRPTPTYNQRYQFQIRHCGTEEIQVKDGGEQIWADGINTQIGELLETKFIDNPASSPYVSCSNIPPFIRTKIVNEIENEFRRYAAVINDPNTPVESLQVIVNIQEAVTFFEDLLEKHNIQGQVVVRL